MKAIAWQIRSQSAGNTAGFVLLSDLTRTQEQDRVEEQAQEIPAAASAEE
jgi:hypothetical protein